MNTNKVKKILKENNIDLIILPSGFALECKTTGKKIFGAYSPPFYRFIKPTKTNILTTLTSDIDHLADICKELSTEHQAFGITIS